MVVIRGSRSEEARSQSCSGKSRGLHWWQVKPHCVIWAANF